MNLETFLESDLQDLSSIFDAAIPADAEAYLTDSTINNFCKILPFVVSAEAMN